MEKELTDSEMILFGSPAIDDDFFEDLEMLEGRKKTSHAVAHRVRRVARHMCKSGKHFRIDKNGLKHESGASKDRLKVIDRLQLLPEDAQIELVKGRTQLVDSFIYVTRNLSNISNGELVLTDRGAKVGRSNLSNGKYDYNFTLTGVQLLYDAQNEFGKFEDDLPEGIRNGELLISHNGKKISSPMVLNVLASQNGYPVNSRFNFLKLNNPKMLLAHKDFSINLSLAKQETGFIKVILYGIEVRTR